jgi:5-deoxy-glucuronate isomerase
MSELLLRSGAWEQVTPESAGWSYLYFGVRTGRSPATGDGEIALCRCGTLPRRGRGIAGSSAAARRSRLPWALYLPRDTAYRVEAAGEVAVCGARCEKRLEPVLVRPEDVEVEVRGSGNATRQINHIVKPEFPAERLLVVEVFTPSGNWSSYPPHKHDEDNPPGEVVLEETYYFRTAAAEAFAVQRLYSPRHGLDGTETVRDGDLMLVPYGYHTTAAAHGYDLYYLNALAGNRRSMASADDPALHWTRAAWAELEPDPRVPLVRSRPYG